MTGQEDRYREYASIAAGHAATALAKLFECTVLMEPPRCWRIQAEELRRRLLHGEGWGASVIADLTGATSGRVGLLLSRGVVAETLIRLLGKDPAGELDDMGCSALAELGNVALSAAVSAIGDLIGGIVLPTVPILNREAPLEALLEALVSASPDRLIYVAETELIERDGPLRLRFIWSPGQ